MLLLHCKYLAGLCVSSAFFLGLFLFLELCISEVFFFFSLRQYIMGLCLGVGTLLKVAASAYVALPHLFNVYMVFQNTSVMADPTLVIISS